MMAGKGDRIRPPENWEAFKSNFERIFGKPDLVEVQPRAKDSDKEKANPDVSPGDS